MIFKNTPLFFIFQLEPSVKTQINYIIKDHVTGDLSEENSSSDCDIFDESCKEYIEVCIGALNFCYQDYRELLLYHSNALQMNDHNYDVAICV